MVEMLLVVIFVLVMMWLNLFLWDYCSGGFVVVIGIIVLVVGGGLGMILMVII